MPALFIPTIGTRLRLTRDWSFPLHFEHRNFDAWELLLGGEVIDRWNYWSDPRRDRIERVTLPMGTVLNVERIYIRSGAGDFDSLTFRAVDGPRKDILPKNAGGTAKKKCRFWAKLSDVNEALYFEVVSEPKVTA